MNELNAISSRILKTAAFAQWITVPCSQV